MLHKIIDAAKGLSRREFARVLAGILLILAMGVMIPIVNNVSERGIVLYAVVCAALIIVLVKDEAVKKAMIIMGFAVTGIVVVTLAPSMSRFVDNRINAQPVPGPVQRRPVYGTVVDPARHPLPGVFVRPLGDATSIIQTDATGRFSLTVLESAIRNNAVVFVLVHAERVDTVSQTLGDGEVTLVLGGAATQPPTPSIVERARQTARLRSSPTRLDPRESALAVIVDSIHALKDGSGIGPAEWSFDVKVSDGTPIHISRSSYSDRGRGSLMLVGSETDVPVSGGETVTITVSGVREVFFWKYRVKGSVPVSYEAVPADQPLRLVVPVEDGERRYNGQFRFFLTVLRLPGRPTPG